MDRLKKRLSRLSRPNLILGFDEHSAKCAFPSAPGRRPADMPL